MCCSCPCCSCPNQSVVDMAKQNEERAEFLACENERLYTLVKEAWGLIASASGGDWSRDDVWTSAAAGWGVRAGFRLTDEQRQDAAVGAALGTQRSRIAEFLLSRSRDERLCAADASHVLRTVARHVREGSLL